ncbi:MAG: DUF2384 domain-containing protein [Gammaproteobacteria bacterium]|nr:DUF2384 domain-containing protein [Gammaproteobacteria bacterium]
MKQSDSSNALQVTEAALQIFFNLSKKWKLSVKQERVLLGSPSEDKFTIWKLSKSDEALDDETFDRISHSMNINKNLCTLLPSKSSEDKCINKPNTAALSHGDTALNYMLDGKLSSIERVHDYLDNEILGIHRN